MAHRLGRAPAEDPLRLVERLLPALDAALKLGRRALRRLLLPELVVLELVKLALDGRQRRGPVAAQVVQAQQAPVRAVVPRNGRAAAGIGNWDSYAAEQPGYEEQVYFMDLLPDANGNTQYVSQGRVREISSGGPSKSTQFRGAPARR